MKGEIKELAEIILEQTNKLLAYEQGAPRIEVDIIKENIRKLYDKMEVLIDVNWQITPPIEQSLEERLDEQVDELLDIAEAEFQGNLKEINELIDEQYESSEEELEIINEEETIIVDKAEEKVASIETPQEEKTENTPTENTGHEPKKQSPKAIDESKSIGDKLLRKPLKSLKTSIGINDKFQFINELFDGSMKVYNQAIDQLEQSDGLKAAMETFNSIAETGGWDTESPAYQLLLDYVERRFLNSK
ncbi:MAG: hypothetical protein DSY76_03685 [Bacteroidetes bacterium]|nr:MAG: hypothetical protein DSY76_03685 [Bacteroidota bacterium]